VHCRAALRRAVLTEISGGEFLTCAGSLGSAASLLPLDETCPEIVPTASYPAWLSFMDDGHPIPLRRGDDDIKETKSSIACSYPCAFPRTLSVHGSQPKGTDPGVSTAIRNAESVKHMRRAARSRDVRQIEVVFVCSSTKT